jgi:hypothetical protein
MMKRMQDVYEIMFGASAVQVVQIASTAVAMLTLLGIAFIGVMSVFYYIQQHRVF